MPQIGCFPGFVAPVERSGADPWSKAEAAPWSGMEVPPWSKAETTRGAKRRQPRGAEWRCPRGAKRRQPRGAEWRQSRRSEMEARRRHDGGTSAKGSELAPQNETDRQRRAGVGAWRGDGVEHGTATRWSEVEGAWERRSGSRRCGPACRCHTSKAAALHARQDGKSASNPTGSLQGIQSGSLQPQLRRSTVRPLPCRGESRPVNGRGPLDVAGSLVTKSFGGCQSFHACARPSGDGASPTPRPAWP